MSSEAVIAVGMAEFKNCIKDRMTLEDRLRATMLAAQDFWMSVDDNVRFQAAIGAVLVSYAEDSEERHHLLRSCESLRKLNAYLGAVQAGLDVKVPELEPDVLPLFKMWQAAKERK